MNIEEFFKKDKPVFSIEVFPPKKDYSPEKILSVLTPLCELKPDFISVTYGAAASATGDFTTRIAKEIKNLGVEPLAHFTCINSDGGDIYRNLQSLKEAGVENVLALRGDINSELEMPRRFTHASDLARIIKQNSDFNVVGACYPEGHYESATLKEDIENLKYKIEAGVAHLITQLFFDNNVFYNFINRARRAGITVPVEAGVMPIVTTRQIERTVALSGASLPPEFTKMVNKYSGNDEALFNAGVDYAANQIIDLIQSGADGIHLYAMNNPKVAKLIYERIKDML